MNRFLSPLEGSCSNWAPSQWRQWSRFDERRGRSGRFVPFGHSAPIAVLARSSPALLSLARTLELAVPGYLPRLDRGRCAFSFSSMITSGARYAARRLNRRDVHPSLGCAGCRAFVLFRSLAALGDYRCARLLGTPSGAPAGRAVGPRRAALCRPLAIRSTSNPIASPALFGGLASSLVAGSADRDAEHPRSSCTVPVTVSRRNGLRPLRRRGRPR